MKQAFANSLADLGGIPLIASECERYGMTWGCDEDCPFFQSGDCHNQEVVEQMLNDESTYNEKPSKLE